MTVGALLSALYASNATLSDTHLDFVELMRAFHALDVRSTHVSDGLLYGVPNLVLETLNF